jgi:hypothetical protein
MESAAWGEGIWKGGREKDKSRDGFPQISLERVR